MTGEAGSGPGSALRHLFDSLRLQARLMWEWRPTRLAILRRAVLSFLGACLALAITAAVLPGLRIDGPGPLLVAGLLLLALDGSAAIALHWLLVAWPILVAQALGLVVQFAAIIVLARLVPGTHVEGTGTEVWAALWLTTLNSLFAELVGVSDDDSYYSVLVRRLVARDRGREPRRDPGMLVVQVDGLSLPVLQHAVRAGRAPVLGRLIHDGTATLHPWVPMLPPTTPASQAGILHGRNDGIAGFRWYEKATARLMVANHPDDAAEIVRRVSDGAGLLVDDGASIGNLVTGDAPRSYLTMATITGNAPPDGGRRLRGFFVTTVDYIRLLVLMVGEVVKELYQAEVQRARSVEPRMHRDLHFAVERAVTNVALRTVSTALVIEEMYGGAPTIYVDYTGYDTIAHHCGPERPEAIDALEGIDRAIGSLLKAGRNTGRAYRLVVLSDHGQSLGATFRQRFGQPLEALIAGLLTGTPTVMGTTGMVESAGLGRHIAAEIGRASGVWPFRQRLVAHNRRPSSNATAVGGTSKPPEAAPAPAAAPADVVVCSSGNLAHIYFTSANGHLTSEEIEERHPGLVDGLAHHPAIGALLVRAADGQLLVPGTQGPLGLSVGQPAGGAPLADYGSRAAEDLRHLQGFSEAGDIILLGAVDGITGEVTGFEDLIGLHGGLGGWQAHPFILCPTALQLAEVPPVGAPALYRQLREWQAQLRESG